MPNLHVKPHTIRRVLVTLAIGFLSLALGCQGFPDRKEQCDGYSNAYALYLASTAVREPSEDEVKIALAAAMFLTAYCGWENTHTSPPGTRSVGPATDRHGVPIIIPPH